MDGDSELSMFNTRKGDLEDTLGGAIPKGVFVAWFWYILVISSVVLGRVLGDDDTDSVSREASPCEEACDSRSSPLACEAAPNPLALVAFNNRRMHDAKVRFCAELREFAGKVSHFFAYFSSALHRIIFRKVNAFLSFFELETHLIVRQYHAHEKHKKQVHTNKNTVFTKID